MYKTSNTIIKEFHSFILFHLFKPKPDKYTTCRRHTKQKTVLLPYWKKHLNIDVGSDLSPNFEGVKALKLI